MELGDDWVVSKEGGKLDLLEAVMDKTFTLHLRFFFLSNFAICSIPRIFRDTTQEIQRRNSHQQPQRNVTLESQRNAAHRYCFVTLNANADTCCGDRQRASNNGEVKSKPVPESIPDPAMITEWVSGYYATKILNAEIDPIPASVLVLLSGASVSTSTTVWR